MMEAIIERAAMQANLDFAAHHDFKCSVEIFFLFCRSFFEILKLLDIPPQWLVKTNFLENPHFQRQYYACAEFHRRQNLTCCTAVNTPIYSTMVHKEHQSKIKELRVGHPCSRSFAVDKINT